MESSKINTVMKYKIKFRPEFDLDLIELDLSLSEYPQKAGRIIAKLDEAISFLTQMPNLYPVYEDFPIFRKIVIEDYLAFYVVNEEAKAIEVHRLIYGGMDLRKWLPYNGD